MNRTPFCELCGSRRDLTWLGNYDGQTGEKLMVSVCPNEKCQNHCEEFFKLHDFKFWSFGRDVCKRCGYAKYTL